MSDNLLCYTIYDIYVLKLEIMPNKEFAEGHKLNINTSTDYIFNIFNFYMDDYKILEIYDINNEIINVNINFPKNNDLIVTNKFQIALDILKYLIFFSDHDINFLSEYFTHDIYFINDINSNYTHICEYIRMIYDNRTNKAKCKSLIKYNEIFNIDKNILAHKYNSCGIIRLYNIKRDFSICIGLEFFHINYTIHGQIKIFLDEEHPIIEGKYIDDKRHGTFCGISYKNGQKTKFLL
jgi:hypothetical protein